MPKPTFDEIVAAADQQITQLQATESALNGDIKAVKDIEFERPLNDGESAQLAQLRQAKASVLLAIEKVSLVTVVNLDQTDEVQQLLNAITDVRLTLETERDSINHVTATATAITKVLTGIAALQAKLAALLA
jgi:hypothetical protein